MGNYNPHAPYIIGPEWVPIRTADFAPDKITESGYTFHIDHSATPITGAYYVTQVPQTKVNNVSDMISVYAAGQEALTGPIKQVAIPVSTVWTTGASISLASVAALANPSDNQEVRFSGPSDGNTFLGMSFDVPAYSQQLFGKRILDVSFRYSIRCFDFVDLAEISTRVGYARNMFSQGLALMFDTLQGTLLAEPSQVNSFSLGANNFFWDATRDIYTVHDIYPWRYQELARFAATEPAPTRMLLTFFNGLDSSNTVFISYVDMLVTYCEENRILYGGRSTTSSQDPSATVTQSNYEVGPNLVRLFDTNFASNTTALVPGDYTVTLTHDDMPIDGVIGSPKVAALRELYQVGPQRGVRVNKSLVPDEEFSLDEIPVLTELTLHTTAAVVTGTHPYGIQDDVPVYGSITAIQEIEDDPVGTVAQSYPQVRFYARRFGNTSVPLALVDVATGLSTASISVTDFDALPEIVDGWREVNLRFTTPPSFSTAAGDIDWRWQAPSEISRNQWQVLGMGSRAFAAHSIGLASYYAPQGNTVTLTWQSPVISGAADDTLSDAVIIFSQDPAAVTGFAVTQETQELAQVTEHCGVPGACVPTEIIYNQLSWPFPPNTSYALDNFDRTEVNGFGSPDVGPAYVLTGAASEYQVNGSYGTITPNTNASSLFATIAHAINFDITADLGVSNNIVATSTARTGVVGRFTNTSNYYLAELRTPASTGITTLFLISRVAGSDTTLVSYALPADFTVNAGAQLRVRFMGQGDRLKAKVWHTYLSEPEGWLAEVTNTALTTGDRVGFFGRTDTIIGNTMTYDNLTVTPPSFWFGKYEVQRRDSITDWQTIMEATSPAVTGFADYEARVGMASEYRIRQCNVLDFCGSAWVTGSGTIPSPGVTVAGDGNSVLIFTSNESPDSNLAYVMQFEGKPVETFAFPEADELQLMRMFGKDFFTAFHPLERGGVQFSRVMLVNAAAIPVPSLPNFNDLRDLAWADLNYVCVRDELGNRWFANIRVPEGGVQMNRTIYLAQVQVTEVTDTPTPVDPEV